jgi:hypothetical protein
MKALVRIDARDLAFKRSIVAFATAGHEPRGASKRSPQSFRRNERARGKPAAATDQLDALEVLAGVRFAS